METDASNFAMGVVLFQEGEERRLHPVAFYSKKCSATEINYKIHDKELLAIVGRVVYEADWDMGPSVRPGPSGRLMGRPIRVKRTLTDPHGKHDLPCPRLLPPGPPHHRVGRRRRLVGRGRKGAHGMSGADPMGDNRTAGADGTDGRARTEVADTGMWARTFRVGTGMWARTLRRV